jgi:phosphatidylcholine synthase
MNIHQVKAAGVHVYTALGLVLAFLAFLALREKNAQYFLITLWLAAVIDGTDGFFARRYQVSRYLPGFNGRKLDDIIDYLMYVFLPVVALVEFEMLTGPLVWVAVLPLLASGYGFCQERAKTSESFVGFPSYWNVLFGYLYFLNFSPTLTAALLVVLSILVFVPIEYIYPTQTTLMRGLTLGLAFVWAAALSLVILFPAAGWAQTVVLASLAFPLYYVAASLYNHRRLNSPA